ncbi:MAG: sugar phosphate isomerase/epimerase family protein [Chthoniobacteraceae bacterium]
MNRRTFLQASLATAALSTLGRAQEPAAKPAHKLAVNLAMVKGESVADRFKMVRDAGFQGIELNRPDSTDLDEIIKAKEATGLEIAGVTCSTHWGKPLTHQDAAVREEGMRGFTQALEDAGKVGAKTVLLVPGVVNADVSYADAYKRSQEAIKAAIPVAEKNGVKIAIENVWNQFLLSPLEAARFVDEINSPWVGWFFDVGNIVAYGWPEHWIRTLGPRILNVHLKEYSRKKRDSEGMGKGFGVELGEGDINWPEVHKALAEVGYNGWKIAEVGGGGADRMKFLFERMTKILTS